MQGGPTPAPPERHEATAPANRRKMKKQVSFSEQELNDHPDSTGKTWQLQYRADRSLATGLATRSACYYQIPKYPASESRRSYNLKHGPRKQDIAQVALHQHSEQQVRKVHIPKSMMDSSFLKHPDLTIGQRQYLWSIAKIYSTAYMQTYLNRQYPTWFRHHREQDTQSQKGTGLKICHENQIKPQHLHQRQSQNETRKMPSKQLTSSLAAASRAYEPKENKERLQSGALLKDRNKPQNNLKPKKRKTPRQKDLTDEPGVHDNVPEETALNESMKAMSIKDEQEEGVSEDLDSRINENEKQDPADTLATTDSTEKEKEKEKVDEQEDTAEAE